MADIIFERPPKSSRATFQLALNEERRKLFDELDRLVDVLIAHGIRASISQLVELAIRRFLADYELVVKEGQARFRRREEEDVEEPNIISEV